LIERKNRYFHPLKKVGDHVIAGDKIGYVDETILVKHYIMLPFGEEGEIIEIKER